MRWDNLFDDLEGQLAQELSAEELDIRVEEERLRLSRLTVRDRLEALHASYLETEEWGVRLQLRSGTPLAVRPRTIGRDWISADEIDESARSRQCIIPLPAIVSIAFTSDQIARSLQTPDAAITSRKLPGQLGLAFILRDLCRRRVTLDLQAADSWHHGTIDRVGREHLDLAIHDRGTFRRESQVVETRVIPFNQIALVRP